MRRKKALKAISVLACALFFTASSGCVSSPGGSADPDVVTVERSKPQAPAWLRGDLGKLSEEGGDFRYVMARDKLLSLPLGLKQAQLAGVEALRAGLGAYAKERLLEAAAARGAPAPADPTALDNAARAASDAAAGPYARVADIYFETRENRALNPGDPMAKTYAAFVLVTFPKGRLPLIYEALGRRLMSAGDPALRRLGPVAQALARAEGK